MLIRSESVATDLVSVATDLKTQIGWKPQTRADRLETTPARFERASAVSSCPLKAQYVCQSTITEPIQQLR